MPLITWVKDFSSWRLAGVVVTEEELELLETALEELEITLEFEDACELLLDSELKLDELLDATELLLMLELLLLELKELE